MVEIIVPVYNVEKYLEECIDSIRKQTYTEIKILLVDNGSTDASGEICDQYSKKYNNIFCYHIGKHPTNTAVLFGISQLQFEYCMFVDSDDWIAPNLVEYLVSNIGDSDGIKCGLTSVWPNRTLVLRSTYSGEYYKSEIEGIVKNFFEITGSISESWSNSRCGKLYKTEILKRIVHMCNPNLYIGEDLLLNLLYLRECNKIIIRNECNGYFVRRRADSITGSFFYELPRYNADFLDECYIVASKISMEGKALKKVEQLVYDNSIQLSKSDSKCDVNLALKAFWKEYVFRRYPFNANGRILYINKVLKRLLVYRIYIFLRKIYRKIKHK